MFFLGQTYEGSTERIASQDSSRCSNIQSRQQPTVRPGNETDRKISSLSSQINQESRKTIGIMTAIPQEFDAFEGLLFDVVEIDPGWRTGTVAGQRVVITLSGIGKVNAASVATSLIERHAPSVVVFSGVAGGLDPSLFIGDVVIGAHTIQHDAGTLGPNGFAIHQAGHVQSFNPSDTLGFRPRPDLLVACERAVEGFVLSDFDGRTPSVVFGTILTGDQFLANSDERDRLFEQFGGQAIEMEGAAVAQVAAGYGIDHLVIRSLSDLAGSESEIDFPAFLHHAASNAASVLERLIPVLEA